MHHGTPISSKTFVCYLLLCAFLGCIVPEEPKFEYKEGIRYIDAFASTDLNASFVTISESIFKFGRLINEPIKGANVVFRNTDSDQRVILTEQDGQYVPPEEFLATPGESWELLITLPDGRRYQSLPEVIMNPIAFSNLKATYSPELTFRSDLERFIPGHFISIDIQDPTDENNYYFWKFRSFEKILFCERCEDRIFRDGKCVENPATPADFPPYTLDYGCEQDCWRIRYNENIKLFSDEFTRGMAIKGLPVADVFLYNKRNIAVELQQYSLSEAAYEYYKIIKDLIDNSGGLNAPPPAALIGNLFNPEDDQEFVLGRFTAAASSTASLFIERENVKEGPAEGIRPFVGVECCPSPGDPCDPFVPLPEQPCSAVITAPCSENRFRTGIKPEVWVD